MTPAATAAPPMIQIGSTPTAATGAGAGGPGGSASGGGAAASGAGATEAAPPEAAPPDAAPPEEAAPPLSPCAKPIPVVEKSIAPPASMDTHFCMKLLPLKGST